MSRSAPYARRSHTRAGLKGGEFTTQIPPQSLLVQEGEREETRLLLICFNKKTKNKKNQEDGVLGFLPLKNPMEEQMGALLRCQNGL